MQLNDAGQTGTKLSGLHDSQKVGDYDRWQLQCMMTIIEEKSVIIINNYSPQCL